MMTHLSCNVIKALEGKTLVTAESCTGGGIGAVLTSVPGSSKVYKGGVISYTNWVKENILDVDKTVLNREGAVSAPVAKMMAEGVREVLQADIGVSVTGLAGPDADEYGYPVGTVFIGYADASKTDVKQCYFLGDRDEIREQTVSAALTLILEHLTSKDPSL